MNEINILHLSDLHFGAQNTKKISYASLVKRESTLKELLIKLKEIKKDWPYWKPDIVVISGDIAFAGRKKDYDEAWVWIKDVLNILDLEIGNLIISPGNHDRNVKNEKLHSDIYPKYPENSLEADELYSKIYYEDSNINFDSKIIKVKTGFENFVSFCNDIYINKLKLKGRENPLVGVREFDSIKFVVLNSASFTLGDEKDRGHLFLGWTDINKIKLQGDLVDPKRYNKEKLTIAIFHHPVEWLDDGESTTLKSHTPSYNYLSDHCHMMLSGHTHTEKPDVPSRRGHGAWHFKIGATYEEQEYCNNCEILKIYIQERKVDRLIIYYDSGKAIWKTEFDDESYHMVKRKRVLSNLRTLDNYNDIMSINETEPVYFRMLNPSATRGTVFHIDIEKERVIRIKRLIEDINTKLFNENKWVLLTGSPALSKTTTIKIIAYDAKKKKKFQLSLKIK